MSKLLKAVNTLLVSIGEEQVIDLTEPSALLAESTLNFVLTELPYTSEDFALDYESLPNEVYNYLVVRANRKFQTNAIASEALYQFTLEDEVSSKRLLIQKKIIPKALILEVSEELSGMLSYADKIPKALKDNLALLKLQALLFSDPATYVVSVATVDMELLNFKKNLILTRDVPLDIVQKVRDHYYARYGFTGAIPTAVNSVSDITEMLKFMASFEFQKALLPVDEYVISVEERNQDELDFRLALIANRMLPSDLLQRVKNEFISTYGYTTSELSTVMKEYITAKAMFRLQGILIANPDQRPITAEDMDNSEATLISRLIVPKELYSRVLGEVKTELAIEDAVLASNLPQAVIDYAKYKSALLHQPTAIKYASKFVLTESQIIRAKAIANQSLPTMSLMDNVSVSKIIERDTNPEATGGSTSTKLRLTV